MAKAKKVVLAYSGGPRSSAAIPWLLESDAHRSRHDEVVAVTVDLGQRVVLEGVALIRRVTLSLPGTRVWNPTRLRV